MTTEQELAIWELCRQGFPLSADDAEASWAQGRSFRPEWRFDLPRNLQRLIEDCNREAEGRWELV
jgi:hypothetical protein